jgi:hypothetical protein
MRERENHIVRSTSSCFMGEEGRERESKSEQESEKNRIEMRSKSADFLCVGVDV